MCGYGGGDVLRGVSLEVAEGGITCVVGPNGAGKSTLMAAISGLLRPRLGSIELDGRDLAGMSPRQVLRLGVVQVQQNHSPVPGHDGPGRTCGAQGSLHPERTSGR